jgi:hypothetical protein
MGSGGELVERWRESSICARCEWVRASLPSLMMRRARTLRSSASGSTEAGSRGFEGVEEEEEGRREEGRAEEECPIAGGRVEEVEARGGDEGEEVEERAVVKAEKEEE